jgi:hypothetical protein
MKTKTITFEHLFNLNISSSVYVKSLPKGNKTKLYYAIDRILRSIQKGYDLYNSKVNDLRTDYASTDEQGNLIINEGKTGNDRYTFKPEKEKALRKAIDNLKNEKVEINIYITTEIPEGLLFNQIEDFRGILIPEDFEYKEGIIEEVKS